jgi:alpha-tubulin suppressor-like RCC1 family protein
MTEEGSTALRGDRELNRAAMKNADCDGLSNKKGVVMRYMMFPILILILAPAAVAQDVVSVCGGDSHSFALRNDGTIVAWGGNFHGQLGDGTNDNSLCPVGVVGLTDVVAIGGGRHHSIALREDGKVFAWGGNYWGQLGDGTTDDSNLPVLVEGLANIVAVSTGAGNNPHSLALDNNAKVWVWGANDQGQCGTGTTSPFCLATEVTGLPPIVAIAAGCIHSVVVTADGDVWSWGDNQNGQLGDGTTTDSTVPIQVPGMSDVVAVAGGEFHTLALKSDGSVWAWGRNHHGQLGDGTFLRSLHPVQVSGLADIVAVSAGEQMSMALKSDGTVWVWGVGGELGNGGMEDSPIPVAAQGITGATQIAALYHHCLALKSDGTVWAWGLNFYGSLGDGTYNDSPVPVQVNFCQPVVTVEIDIKPGSDPNSINLGSAGVVPAAILSSATFDAVATVDPDTLALAGASVKMVGKSNKLLCHGEDVNGDNLADLVCQFETAQFLIEPGESIAVLEGNTYDDVLIRGEDVIRIVPE